MTLNDVTKLLAPLRTRIANTVARAVVRLVDDGTKLQALQLGLLADETREGMERFQNYGFTSVPLPGAEAVVVFVGGRRDHGLAIAVDDRAQRMKGLQPGEVAVYSNAGQHILLKADGSIEIGGGTMQPAALGQDVRDELDAIWTALSTHIHTGGTISGNTGTATVSPSKKTVKSATVKVRA